MDFRKELYGHHESIAAGHIESIKNHLGGLALPSGLNRNEKRRASVQAALQWKPSL
jgi:hypothetical protein